MLPNILAALLFIASSGILFQERFRKNVVLLGIVSILAFVSSYFLIGEISSLVASNASTQTNPNSQTNGIYTEAQPSPDSSKIDVAPEKQNLLDQQVAGNVPNASELDPAQTSASDFVPAMYGKAYSDARTQLIDAGWIPTNTRWQEREKLWAVPSAIWAYGYQEIEDCSGTGMAHCRFSFHSHNGTILTVVTAGEPLGEIDFEKNEFISGEGPSGLVVNDYWTELKK